MFLGRSLFIAFNLSLLWTVPAWTQVSQANVKPSVDWQKHATDDHSLSSLGENLMGDMIDYNTGSISFEHTDVSIPGNNGLQVAVKRRLSRGILSDISESSEFGDWEIVAPKITATTAPGTNFRTGQRCSDGAGFQPLTLRFNTVNGQINQANNQPYFTKPLYPHQYTQGMSIQTVEYGSEKVLRTNLASNFGPYSTSDKYVTRGHFKISCLSNITGGGEGFLALSPDGITYRFDRYYDHRTEDDVLSNLYGADKHRYRSVIAATEVTDIHGNWVRYTYDTQNRLTRIHSNDGREITLVYYGNNHPIRSVTANGRTWEYSYAVRGQAYSYVEWGGRAALGGQPFMSLVKVDLPDGRDWLIHNDEMYKSAGFAGCTSSTRRSIGGDAYTFYIKHPSGMWGAYKFDTIRRRVSHDILESQSVLGYSVPTSPNIPDGKYFDLACPHPSSINKLLEPAFINGVIFHGEPDVSPGFMGRLISSDGVLVPEVGIPAPLDEEGPYDPRYVPSMSANLPMFKTMIAVTKKRLVENLNPFATQLVAPMEWTIDYEESPLRHYANPGSVPNVPVEQRTNWTKVTLPDNSVRTLEYHWDAEPLGGEIKRQDLRAFDNGPVLKTVDLSYAKQPVSVGITTFGSVYPPASLLGPIVQTQSILSQDGDTYTTEIDYNLDIYSAGYSFGNPIQTRNYSSFSVLDPDPQRQYRTVDTVYEHNLNQWVLGLPKTISRNGELVVGYDYNPVNGLKESMSRYGHANFYTFQYHPDGSPYTVTDALGRVTQATNWKRGTAQTLWKAFGTSDAIKLEQVIDDNGWVTSATDAKNATTVFGHNAMGWVTSVDLPGSIFNTTNINYAYGASDFGGVLQTLSKGSATTEVHHDAMNRPRRTEQLTSGWSSVSEAAYDVLGRVSYQSRPFATGGASTGTRTHYDALGRITRVEDTTDPISIFTAYSYASSNRTRVDNPDGRYTITSRDGYSGPGKGDVSQIAEFGASGSQRETYLYRNDLDSLTWLRQIDFTGTTPKEISQHFVYDAQQRLCAHYVPEHNETRYTYDPAGQLITYAKGLNRTAYSGTTSCAGTAGATSLVTLGYDALGRVETKDFADAATLDVENVYDANGNLEHTFRRPLGGATVNQLSRTYDVLNNILTEQQIVVGAPTSLNLGYEYDANGFMNERRYPSGMTQTWTNDGFGHQQNLAQGNYSYASNILYHPDGSLKSYAAGNGQAFTRNLDALQRTERLKSTGAITALDLTYAYDTNSRITSITDGSTPGANAAGKTHSVANLQYDALGHMTRADGWWGTGTFAYDGFGNLGKRWLSETGPNPRRIWNFYDANNRVFVTDDSLPTTSGGASWHSHSYDDRGNMTRSGSSLNNAHTMFMTYDMSDQMVGMSGHNLQEDSLSASYQYNGLGKRVYTNMNGRKSYPMYDAGGALRSVYKVHDAELVEQISLQNGHPLAKWTGSTLTYLHADHLGTPIRGTHGLGGTSGLTVGDESFQDFNTPYGLNPTSGWWGNADSGFDPITGQGSNCGVTGFTTHAKDCESGLQYMQARHYSPVRGGFMSIDPVTFTSSGGNPGYFNRYAYTMNDPVNNFDPDGRACAPCVAVVAYVGAEARRGARKGIAGALVATTATQFVTETKISPTVQAVSAAKGALVGAVQEIFESPAITSAVAGAAGFVDGAVTDFANGGDVYSAVASGSIVASADSAAAFIGALHGDEAGAAAAVAFSTAAQKVPGAAKELQEKSGMIGQTMDQNFSNISSEIGSLFEKMTTGSGEQETYDEVAED